MTTAVAHRLSYDSPETTTNVTPPSGRTLGSLVATASDAVAEVPLDDPRWDDLGLKLTSFVHAARLAAGLPGSPIRPDEAVAAVMRVRDLGRLAQFTAASVAFADAEAEAGLRSLQASATSR